MEFSVETVNFGEISILEERKRLMFVCYIKKSLLKIFQIPRSGLQN